MGDASGIIARTLRSELLTLGLSALLADVYVDLLLHGARSTSDLAARVHRSERNLGEVLGRLLKFGIISQRQTGSGRIAAEASPLVNNA